MRWVSSRFLTAFPRLFDASSNSADNRSVIVFSLRSRAAEAARAHLDGRHDVFQRLLEYRDRILLGLALDHVERAIDNGLGNRFLAGMHDRIHEFRNDHVAE